ncbi:hypothetical protein NVV30_03495 [Pseudomonas syringae]|uniref:hypothetical protein n=1 Tax=Pseudomonas syringae TaxID=317 RepID=UPI00215A2635|nr:hypothetical protein [Pseudomonas syringae]MCR8717758.1 hypothetical protein [Pseudomonas syringae]
MLKFTASALLIVATLGLGACDSKSEQKAQDAQAHQEKSQEKMESAQDKVNEAAKENTEAAKDKAASKEAAAEESKTFVPTSEVTKTIQPEKK